ncbi:MAG: STAS-like domain-containing protein [Candidatus Binataceae bacterium]
MTERFPVPQFSSHSFPPEGVYLSWGMKKKAMTRIEIKHELGNEVVSRQHGEKMRALLEKALETSGSVVVDFAGMQITSVSFFDESFGMLAKRYGEDLLTKIKLREIDPFDLALVRDIVASRSRETKKKMGKQASR